MKFLPKDRLSKETQTFAWAEKKAIRIWNLTTNKQLKIAMTNPMCLSFNSKGTALACISEGKATLWNPKTAKVVKTIGRKDVMSYVAFSPDGNMLIFVYGQQVTLWDLTLDKEVWTINAQKKVQVKFNPYGNTLALVSYKEVRICELESGRELAKISAKSRISGLVSGGNVLIELIAFLNAKELIAIYGNKANIWDISSGKKISQFIYSVYPAVLSPDGRTFISLSEKGIWDIRNGKKITQLARERAIYTGSIVFSPDAKTLAAASSQAVQLFNLHGKIKSKFAFKSGQDIHSIAFSPNALMLAASNNKIAKLWHIDGREIFSFKSVNSLVFSYDNRILALTNLYKTTKLWDITNKREIAKFRGVISPIVFSPDKMILAAVYKEEVALWNIASASKIKTFRTKVRNGLLAFSPNGKILAIYDYGIKLWSMKTYRKIKTLKDKTNINFFTFSPDGKIFAAIEHNKLWLWSTNTFKEIVPAIKKVSKITALAFGPYGKILAFARDKSVTLFDIAARKEIAILTVDAPVNSIVFNPQENVLACSSSWGSIRVWDIAIFQPIKQKTFVEQAFASSLAFSPDSKMLFTSTGKIWDLATGLARKTKLGGRSLAFLAKSKTVAISSLANELILWRVAENKVAKFKYKCYALKPIFSINGRFLVFIAQNSIKDATKTVRVWDVVKGKEIIKIAKTAGAVAINSDGEILALATDRKMELWSIPQKKPIKTIQCQNIVRFLTFSPDGQILAGAIGNKIKFWDASGKEIVSFDGHPQGINFLAFSFDGRTLASAAKDIKLWDVALGIEIARLRGYKRGVISLAFDPESKILATFDLGRNIKIWDIAYAKQKHTYTPRLSAVKSIALDPHAKMAAISLGNKVELWHIGTGKLLKITSSIPKNWKRQLLAPTSNKSSLVAHIPNWLIEIALNKQPKQIAQSLFEWQATDDFLLKKYFPVFLWDYKIDPNSSD